MRETFYSDPEQSMKSSAKEAWAVRRFLIVVVKTLHFKFNLDKLRRGERKVF